MIILTPAHDETHVLMSINGKASQKYDLADIARAKKEARILANAGMAITLKRVTVKIPDACITEEHYDALCEGLYQDSATRQAYREMVAEHGAPSWA